MTHWSSAERRDGTPGNDNRQESEHRILTDGGRESSDAEGSTADEENSSEDDAASTEDSSNVDVREEGEVDPAKPTWEKPDLDDIPEVDGPKTQPAPSSGRPDTERDAPEASTGGDSGGDTGSEGAGGEDPTAGMPNTARSPGQSRLKEAGLEGYIVALELTARLPEDLRLPEEAEDLVPVAFEAELEQDIQAFAADQFDNPSPHVETLDFVEVDGEPWLRLRLGIDPESFADLDPKAIQEHALQQVDRLM